MPVIGINQNPPPSTSMSKDFWIAIVFLVSLVASGFAGWSLRGERIQTKIVKIQVKQQDEVEKVKTRKAARDIVYVDRIKVIHDAQDNCLVQSLPPDILQVLRSGPAQSGIDEGLRLSETTGGNVP